MFFNERIPLYEECGRFAASSSPVFASIILRDKRKTSDLSEVSFLVRQMKPNPNQKRLLPWLFEAFQTHLAEKYCFLQIAIIMVTHRRETR